MIKFHIKKLKNSYVILITDDNKTYVYDSGFEEYAYCKRWFVRYNSYHQEVRMYEFNRFLNSNIREFRRKNGH